MQIDSLRTQFDEMTEMLRITRVSVATTRSDVLFAFANQKANIAPMPIASPASEVQELIDYVIVTRWRRQDDAVMERSGRKVLEFVAAFTSPTISTPNSDVVSGHADPHLSQWSIPSGFGMKSESSDYNEWRLDIEHVASCCFCFLTGCSCLRAPAIDAEEVWGQPRGRERE